MRTIQLFKLMIGFRFRFHTIGSWVAREPSNLDMKTALPCVRSRDCQFRPTIDPRTYNSFVKTSFFTLTSSRKMSERFDLGDSSRALARASLPFVFKRRCCSSAANRYVYCAFFERRRNSSACLCTLKRRCCSNLHSVHLSHRLI
jgi:hypothetical protein